MIAFVFHLPNVGIWDGIHLFATAIYAGLLSICAIDQRWKHLMLGVRSQSETTENDLPNCTRRSSGVRGRKSCALDTPTSASWTTNAQSSASAMAPLSTALARDCTLSPTTCPPLLPNCKFGQATSLPSILSLR